MSARGRRLIQTGKTPTALGGSNNWHLIVEVHEVIMLFKQLILTAMLGQNSPRHHGRASPRDIPVPSAPVHLRLSPNSSDRARLQSPASVGSVEDNTYLSLFVHPLSIEPPFPLSTSSLLSFGPVISNHMYPTATMQTNTGQFGPIPTHLGPGYNAPGDRNWQYGYTAVSISAINVWYLLIRPSYAHSIIRTACRLGLMAQACGILKAHPLRIIGSKGRNHPIWEMRSVYSLEPSVDSVPHVTSSACQPLAVCIHPRTWGHVVPDVHVPPRALHGTSWPCCKFQRFRRPGHRCSEWSPHLFS